MGVWRQTGDHFEHLEQPHQPDLTGLIVWITSTTPPISSGRKNHRQSQPGHGTNVIASLAMR
jgi:hypothetical protein